jgi:hypothetical protein
MTGLLLAALLHAAPAPGLPATVLKQGRDSRDAGAQRAPPRKKKRKDEGSRSEEEAVRPPSLSDWAARP